MADDKYPPAPVTYTDQSGQHFSRGTDEGHAGRNRAPAMAAQWLQSSAPDGGPLFTWEDVQKLRRVNDWIVDGARYHRVEDAFFHDLAARLASLLPPEDL